MSDSAKQTRPAPATPQPIPALVVALAMAIEGPFDPDGVLSADLLEKMREAKWKTLSNMARGVRLKQARSILVYLGVGPHGRLHTGAAAALGWVKAIAAARGVAEAIPEVFDIRRDGAVRVLRAIYSSAEDHGLTFSRPAYLAPDPRQGTLGITV